MKSEIKRIALIGPESSGKTTLCEQLASNYKTVWVPEYSREYVSKLNRPYTKDDVIYCAKMQLHVEEEFEKRANKFLFSDTELIVAKVWLLDVFGDCPEWIEEKIEERKYDLYLLTRPDLPFVEDPVRENANRREYFFDWYKSELDKRNFKYEIVEGVGEKRFENAIKCLNFD